MKIGIIGAENSHTAAIAKVINIEKKIKGCVVDCVWGETAEFARSAAKAGRIGTIVKRQKDMMGRIDALIVDHRHAKYHLPAARPFVAAGVPTFVDKPFCYRAAEGRAFLQLAKRCKTPVTSFSTLPRQQSFKRFVRKMGSLGEILFGESYGPCDLACKWGGVFFYGIHQVDMVLVALGYNVSSVLITRGGNGSTGQLIYSDGKIVTMNLIKKGCTGFAMAAMGTKGGIHQAITSDKSGYLSGIREFTNMFKTGKEPVKHEHMLKPVRVLEALERSAKSGRRERVGR